MANRREAEDFILSAIDQITGTKSNRELYRKAFDKMNDKEFAEFMKKGANKEISLQIIVPNGDKKSKLSVENNLNIAKKMKIDFFQHLTIGPTKNVPKIKTTNKYMVINLPYRRVTQSLSKKIGIPKNNHSVDLLTGQVTGDSKGSKITYPELQILTGLGLESILVEFTKLRGGDRGAQMALESQIENYGSGSIKNTLPFSTGVKSKKTLKAYLRGMHLKSTL